MKLNDTVSPIAALQLPLAVYTGPDSVQLFCQVRTAYRSPDRKFSSENKILFETTAAWSINKNECIHAFLMLFPSSGQQALRPLDPGLMV